MTAPTLRPYQEDAVQGLRDAPAPHFNTTHGCSTGGRRRLYDVWRQMHRRCYSPACKDYPAWGGRGIAVCDAWHDVRAFVAWAESSGYRRGVTIERVDNNGNYEPSNCRWIPNEQQASNTRRLTFIDAFGQRRRIDDWAVLTGIGYRTIKMRLALGWDVERALTEMPVLGKNQAGLPRSLR